MNKSTNSIDRENPTWLKIKDFTLEEARYWLAADLPIETTLSQTGADSLDLIEYLMFAEEEFKITLEDPPDDWAGKLDKLTLADLVDFVYTQWAHSRPKRKTKRLESLLRSQNQAKNDALTPSKGSNKKPSQTGTKPSQTGTKPSQTGTHRE